MFTSAFAATPVYTPAAAGVALIVKSPAWIVSWNTADVLPIKPAFPWYTAVRLCTPAVEKLAVRLAVPAGESCDEPSDVEPSKKDTLLLSAWVEVPDETVAVIVTVWGNNILDKTRRGHIKKL